MLPRKKKNNCSLQTWTWFPVLYLGIRLALSSPAMVPAEYTHASRYHNPPGAQKCGWDVQHYRELINKSLEQKVFRLLSASSRLVSEQKVAEQHRGNKVELCQASCPQSCIMMVTRQLSNNKNSSARGRELCLFTHYPALIHAGLEIREWSSSRQLQLLGAGEGAWSFPKRDTKPLKSHSFTQLSALCETHSLWGGDLHPKGKDLKRSFFHIHSPADAHPSWAARCSVLSSKASLTLMPGRCSCQQPLCSAESGEICTRR